VLKSVLDNFKRDIAIAISQDFMDKSDLKGCLVYIKRNFSILEIIITSMKEQGEGMPSVVGKIR